MKNILALIFLFSFSFTSSAEIGFTRENVNIDPKNDPRIFSVKLERSGCYGTCPAFDISISADGKVEYKGYAYVKLIGSKEGQLLDWQIERLFEYIHDINIFSYRDKYTQDVTDSATDTITVTLRNGKVKKITNYANTAPSTIWAVAELISWHVEKVKWKGN